MTLGGIAQFPGATRAGAAAGGLAMLASFLGIPYAPFWAVLLIAINGFVMCAPF
jgi:hypothetical protein